jgi:phage shock protein C
MQPPSNQNFYRGADRIVGGVCSGLAEGFHVEALWVRLAFVVLAFLNGIGVLLYLVLWVLMPERTGTRTSTQGIVESMGNDVKRAWADLRSQFGGTGAATTSPTSKSDAPPPSSGSVSGEPGPLASTSQPVTRNPSFIFGAILIVIGIAFLAANTNFVNWSVIWPSALVALGIALLIRNLQKRS